MDTPEPSIKTEIEKTLKHMSDLHPGSDEYDKALKHLKALSELQKGARINPEVIVGAVTNLAGILLVLNYERLNVISSRAMMFVRRSS